MQKTLAVLNCLMLEVLEARIAILGNQEKMQMLVEIDTNNLVLFKRFFVYVYSKAHRFNCLFGAMAFCHCSFHTTYSIFQP